MTKQKFISSQNIEKKKKKDNYDLDNMLRGKQLYEAKNSFIKRVRKKTR